jgi:uncharacterized membrane protein HdeD (DUF308 family)
MPSRSALSFLSEELNALKQHWGLFLAFGIVLIVVGLLAILMPFVAGVSTALFIGILLVIGGITEIVGAFRARCWGAFFLHVLIGVIYAVTGLLMVEQPVEALLVLTILVAVALLVDGMFRIIFSLLDQFPGWGWMLAGGIIDVILGLMIWRKLPDSALWVIGLFVGISMLYNGSTWVALALSLREVPAPPGAVPAPPAATSTSP